MRPDILVVGGGAAGVFAAIEAANRNPLADVVVVEQGSQLLSKVRISGGGRCNVTHACFEPHRLIEYYPRGAKELRGAFHTWQPANTMEWFEDRGVSLKIEADGRVFPVSDDSQTVVDCLVREAKKAGVNFRLGKGLSQLRWNRNTARFEARLTNGASLSCRRVLLATGGLKPGALESILNEMGHRIEALAPSLFSFNLRDPRTEGLQGLSVQKAQIRIIGTSIQESGPLLITHWGMSGPVILKLSAWGARWMKEHHYRFPIRVNWAGDLNQEEVAQRLDSFRQKHARRLVRNGAAVDVPLRIWERLLAASGISSETVWGQLSRGQVSALRSQIGGAEFQVLGKGRFKEEFVTCGGVSLKEVHFKTMQSRRVSGLYFAGELLDIDGLTGGFNFQSAWTTGMLAGRAMAASWQPDDGSP